MSDLERRADAVIESAVRFEAKEDHVVAVLPVEGFGTIGVRFVNPEHMMEFCTGLIEAASEIWPDHPIIKMYKED